MKFTVFLEGGLKFKEIYYSLGGGFIKRDKEKEKKSDAKKFPTLLTVSKTC